MAVDPVLCICGFLMRESSLGLRGAAPGRGGGRHRGHRQQGPPGPPLPLPATSEGDTSRRPITAGQSQPDSQMVEVRREGNRLICRRRDLAKVSLSR